MSKYEIANWLTPGLTPIRLVFVTYGGSAHGELKKEAQNTESGDWKEIETIGAANGVPKTVGEKVSEQHVNQFTGETVE